MHILTNFRVTLFNRRTLFIDENIFDSRNFLHFPVYFTLIFFEFPEKNKQKKQQFSYLQKSCDKLLSILLFLFPSKIKVWHIINTHDVGIHG